MALVSGRSVSLILTSVMDIIAVVIVVSAITWSIITSMKTSIFFTSQRRGSSFTINTLKLRLVMRCHFSMITSRLTVAHHVLRVGRWRISIHRFRMSPEVFLAMPVICCVFSFDLRRRLWLTIIGCLSLPIRCVRVSRRIPNIGFTLVMLKHLISY